MLPELPSGGQFGISQVIPVLRATLAECDERRDTWRAAQDYASQCKSDAKKTRANLIVTLRAFGNTTSGDQIKTSAACNEWADADPAVQAAELAADLASNQAKTAKEAYEDAQQFYKSLMTLQGMERDQMQAERRGDQ